MRLSIRDEPGFTSGIPGRGQYAMVYLDGKVLMNCLKADDERGYVDVMTDFEHYKRYDGDSRVHRLFGKVEIRIKNYLEEANDGNPF